MPILQHYYTSYINEATEHVGFEVKAISPGISSKMEVTIKPLISYRIPPSLDERNIDTHPVALRYFYEGPERCYLLCSQSCGSDSDGRPGNFFAHTLVLSPDIFDQIPPILFWKSPFWQREDSELHSSIDSLPILSSFNESLLLLNPDDVWDFLAPQERRELLYKLLCAVIQSKKTFRRVVILDTIENVVWWIVAVSVLLPPDYRPLLSFATYHHNPRQGLFLITGTTSDSSFGTSADYRDFFVLNAETGKTSEVENSAYARLATQMAQPDLYDERLLPLFTDYVQRFPKPTQIDEQLDSFALYAGLHTAHNALILSLAELEAISIALSSFEQMREYSPQDIEELNNLQQVLAQSARLAQNYATTKELGRIEALLKKHKAQSGIDIENDLKKSREQDRRAAENEQRIDKEQDSVISERSTYKAQDERPAPGELAMHKVPNEPSIEDDLKRFVLNMLTSGDTDVAHLGQIQQRYGSETLVTSINSPEYLSWLIPLLKQVSSQRWLSVWQSIGSYIQPTVQSQQILMLSLLVVARLWDTQRSDEGKVLLTAMWRAMKGNEQAWLQLAVDNYPNLPHGLVELFYYSFAHDFKLDKRVLYRNIIMRISKIILNYEIVSDVSSSDAKQGLMLIEGWMNHTQQNGYEIAPLIELGLSQFQEVCSPQEWKELAPSILRNTLLTPLPKRLEDQLVFTEFSTFSLGQLSFKDLPLYERYKECAVLSKETRTALADILSLTRGHLDATQAQRLHEQAKALDAKEYQAVVKQCIPSFFKNTVTHDEHRCLIRAFFIWNSDYAPYFWQTYWETFKDMLTPPLNVSKFVSMLNFWFLDASPDALQQAYIVQVFFLQLPSHLSEIQQDRRFQEGIREFNKVASKPRYSWYRVVEDFFTEKKGAVGSFVSKLSRFWQREGESKSPDEEAQEEARRQAFAAKVGKLFDGKVQDQHGKLLAKLYDESRLSEEWREQFWPCYWQELKEIMTSGNAEGGLTVLSFWFDMAFKKLDGVRYAPQEFFMHLPMALETARGGEGRAFRETALLIDKNATLQAQRYPWYPLMQEYFVDGQEGSR